MSNPNAAWLVGVCMGSDSDLPVMQGAIDVLREFQIPHEVRVLSAHRTPERMYEYARAARERGVSVIIAGAGGAAHLPGMIASITSVPVIGVPVKTRTLQGVDSLLSIVQMPPAVPVATMAINGAMNAGLFAVRMMAMTDADLRGRLDATIVARATKIADTDARVEGEARDAADASE